MLLPLTTLWEQPLSCKTCWAGEEKAALGILSFEGRLILLASSLKKVTSDSKRELTPKGTLSVAMQKTDAKPKKKKNLEEIMGAGFPPSSRAEG